LTICITQVKDWGSGEPSDLGGLEVESFSPDIFSDHSKPFYEQLARRLEELQVSELVLLSSDFAAAAAAAAFSIKCHQTRLRFLSSQLFGC